MMKRPLNPAENKMTDNVLQNIAEQLWDSTWLNIAVVDWITSPRAKVEEIMRMQTEWYTPYIASYPFAKDVITIFDSYCNIFSSYGLVLLNAYVKEVTTNTTWKRNEKKKKSWKNI